MGLHRRFTLVARVALTWFTLALAVAVVAPLVQPRATTLVCNAQGELRVLVQTADGWSEPEDDGRLHCTLCLFGSSGAAMASAPANPLTPVAVGLTHGRLQPSWHAAHEARAPLPARGPPLLS